jgi:hypothetical protein
MSRCRKPLGLVALALAAWACCSISAQPTTPTVAPLCWFCHPWATDEWRDSAHGQSTTNPAFVAALAKAADPNSCFDCHAPEPVLVTGIGAPPMARGTEREQGIACRSCHQDGAGAQVGPLACESSQSHSSVEDQGFHTSPDLCAVCHGAANPLYDQMTSFRAAHAPDDGVSCQKCHLPRETGPIAYNTRDVRYEHSRHDALGPDVAEFLAGAARLDLSHIAGRADASLVNTGTGHNLPGSAGPVITLELTALGKDGAALATASSTVGWDGKGADERLAPGKDRAVSLTLPPETVRVRAVARYRDEARGLSTEMAKQEVDL